MWETLAEHSFHDHPVSLRVRVPDVARPMGFQGISSGSFANDDHSCNKLVFEGALLRATLCWNAQFSQND